MTALTQLRKSMDLTRTTNHRVLLDQGDRVRQLKRHIGPLSTTYVSKALRHSLSELYHRLRARNIQLAKAYEEEAKAPHSPDIVAIRCWDGTVSACPAGEVPPEIKNAHLIKILAPPPAIDGDMLRRLYDFTPHNVDLRKVFTKRADKMIPHYYSEGDAVAVIGILAAYNCHAAKLPAIY